LPEVAVPAGVLVVVGAVVEVVDDFFSVEVARVDVDRVEVVLTGAVDVAAAPETFFAPQMPELPKLTEFETVLFM